MRKFIPIFFIALIFALTSFAQSVRDKHTLSTLLPEVTTAAPGEPFWVAWQLESDPHWHTYWQNPGDSGIASQLDFTLPEGWEAETLRYPAPQKIVVDPIVTYGFEGEAIMLTRITPAPDAQLGQSVTLSAQATYLMCKEICLPGSADHSFSVKIGAQSVKDSAFESVFSRARAALPTPLAADLTVEYENGTFALTLPEQAHEKGVQFIPFKEGIINDLAPQPFKNGVLFIEADSLLDEAPAELHGLLVTKNGEAFSFASAVTVVAGTTPMQEMPPQKAAEKPAQQQAAPAPQAPPSLWWALVAAFLAGLILNLMPCVLPVLSLKVLSLVKLAHGGRAIGHGVAYTLGILLTFWVFAGVIALLQQLGHAAGWGFHLQEPLFVLGLIYLLVILSLNLAGVFEWGGSLSKVGGAGGAKQGLRSSFFSGVLITIVATPCTVPFMGTAVGFALSQSLPILFATFAMMALGLGAPFVVLGLFPSLRGWVPKPGNWLIAFKQFLAFPLIATALWLLWVYQGQVGGGALFSVLLTVLALTFACWIFGKLNTPAASARSRKLGWLVLLATVWLAFMVPQWHPVLMPESSPQAQEVVAPHKPLAWSPERVATAIKAGQPVFVYFTADWCITCKVNENLTLKKQAVQQAFVDNNVLVLMGDWTDANEQIAAELKRHGRHGVPLYLYYPAGESEPQILPQLLTPQLVIERL